MSSMEQVDKFLGDCSDSEKINPSVPVEAIQKVKEFRNPDRRISSKSTVVYEIVKMFQDDIDSFEAYKDGLDIGEDSLEEQLENEGATLRVSQKHPKKIFSESSEKRQITLFLPASFVDSLPSRGMGDVICEAVSLYMNSSFSSREDRIRAKKDLLDYVRNDREPTHRVVREMVEEGVLEDNEGGYWATNADVADIYDNSNWTDITQGPDRIEALQEYYNRVVEKVQDSPEYYAKYLPATEEDLHKEIAKFYNASKPTRKDYFRKLHVSAEWLDIVEEQEFDKHSLEALNKFKRELGEQEKIVVNEGDKFRNHHRHPVVTNTEVVKFICANDPLLPDINIHVETDTKTGDRKFIIRPQ